jgi:hypothetical protein
MDKAKNIKEDLLKQMDGDSAKTTDVSETSTQKIIYTHKIQLRRRKWIAAIGWLITFLYAVGMHNLKVYVFKYNIEDVLTREEFWFIRFSDMALIVVIIISILLTYLVYAKSRTLTLLQICARLARIEEHLKKISQDKSTVSET